MGKKAKLKAIRRIASTLPEIPVRGLERKVVSGAELIEQGVKKVEGGRIDPSKDYISKKVVPVAANHAKLMKRAYNKYGNAGIRGYMGQVEQYQVERKKLADANHS